MKMKSAERQSIQFKTQRGELLKRTADYTGIDFIETRAHPVGGWILAIHFFPPGAAPSSKGLPAPLGFSVPPGITPADIRITAKGECGAALKVLAVNYPAGGLPVLTVHVTGETRTRDFLLELTGVAGMDPFFSAAWFFLDDAAQVDPRPLPTAEAAVRPESEINYLAKDYAGFRRLILDRMALSAPIWKERHIPDMGIAVIEILAYAADYLSYYQDAAATEAYLGTARRRVSVRRHARLLDYPMHQGSNSRIPVQVRVNDTVSLPKSTPLITRFRDHRPRITPEFYTSNIRLGNFQVKVFETMAEAELRPEHNRIHFYTWGAAGFVLEKGCTGAALEGRYPYLKMGDLLVIEESWPHGSGVEGNRDFFHTVRLSRPPVPGVDPPLGREITRVTWADSDALPRALVITDDAHSHKTVTLRGNIVLADFGRTLRGEELPEVPAEGNYYPRLKNLDLVYAAPFSPAGTLPAAVIMNPDPADAVPAVRLHSQDGLRWNSRRDLLSSDPFARDFVVETESDGGIYLRFGDGKLGKKPGPGMTFKAVYRFGRWSDGGVEAGAIAHIVSDNGRITGVSNLGASGGHSAPETIHQVRLNAPQAFKTQERCITPRDYVAIAQRHPGVQKAQAEIRWTGSWNTAFIYIDRFGGQAVDQDFKNLIQTFMAPYRPTGSDIEVAAPRYTALCITLTVYTGKNVSRGPVRQRLKEVFSNARLSTGAGGDATGFFHPDNFTFGRALYAGEVVASAMAVTGVVRVDVEEFRRYSDPPGTVCKDRVVTAGPLEILRLDNSAGSPRNGSIRFIIREGDR